jgi:hypothetical protein
VARPTDQRRYGYSHKRRLESLSDCRCGAEMVAECVLI